MIGYHFAGKDEVLAEVVTEVLSRAEAYMRQRIGGHSTGRETLRAYIESNLGFMSEYRSHVIAIAEIARNARRADGSSSFDPAILEAATAGLARLLADYQKTGEFRADFDPHGDGRRDPGGDRCGAASARAGSLARGRASRPRTGHSVRPRHAKPETPKSNARALIMYTLTSPRSDLRTNEVVQALRDRLGPGYNVLPGMRQTRARFSEPVPGSPDTIVVGTSSNRVQRAQVTIVRGSGRSEIHISPGGVISDLVLNTLVIARKVHRVLASTPGPRAASESETTRQ